MNEIEAKVVMPPGAHEIGEYARYYASGPKNDILVVYVLPSLLLKREQESCEELGANGQGHPVPCSSLAREGAPKLDAGSRYWMKDWGNLPWISDLNCGTVAFVFNQGTKEFTEMRCFGAKSDPYVIRD